jgi:hypothetical protein
MLTWYPIENVNEGKSEMQLPQPRWAKDDRLVFCPKVPQGHRLWQVKDERGGGERWWILALPQDYTPSESVELVPEIGYELHYFELRAEWQSRTRKKK